MLANELQPTKSCTTQSEYLMRDPGRRCKGCRIRWQQGALSLGMWDHKVRPGSPAQLVFHQVGKDRFLAEMHHPQAGTKIINKSIREREQEKEFKARAQTITIAAQAMRD